MKFYGKSEEVAQKILDLFENGDVPKALKQVFHQYQSQSPNQSQIPSYQWSWSNRFIQAINGTQDARGFKQWLKVGRSVKKGSKAFYILAPCVKTKEDPDTHEKKSFLYGFKSVPVFSIEDTDILESKPDLWNSINQRTQQTLKQEQTLLTSLPLFNVAIKWDLNVTFYPGKNLPYLGYFSPTNQTIALGVENLSTWLHELVHAADHKNGTLKNQRQNAGNEIVAEFGGATLLTMLNLKHEADLGGAWDYILSYANNDKAKAIGSCLRLINRVCANIDLILRTAHQVSQDYPEQSPEPLLCQA